MKWLSPVTFYDQSWVRIPNGIQISEVINLGLRGSKLSNDYGVLEHGKIKYENGKYPLKKLTSGLRFESLLVSNLVLVEFQKGNTE